MPCYANLGPGDTLKISWVCSSANIETAIKEKNSRAKRIIEALQQRYCLGPRKGSTTVTAS